MLPTAPDGAVVGPESMEKSRNPLPDPAKSLALNPAADATGAWASAKAALAAKAARARRRM